MRRVAGVGMLQEARNLRGGLAWFSDHRGWPLPVKVPGPDDLRLFRVTPLVISVLDDAKGFSGKPTSSFADGAIHTVLMSSATRMFCAPEWPHLADIL